MEHIFCKPESVGLQTVDVGRRQFSGLCVIDLKDVGLDDYRIRPSNSNRRWY